MWPTPTDKIAICGTRLEGWEPVMGMSGDGILRGAAWGWRGAMGKAGECWACQCPSFPSPSSSLLGGGGRRRRRPPRTESLAMEETNTTDLSLSYVTSGYAVAQAVDQSWCITENYSMLIISGVCIGICLCGLVGNVVVVWFLGFHMKKSPFTIYVLNLAIADFSLLLFLLVILTLYIISAVYCIFSFRYHLSKYILMDLFLFWYFASMYLLTAMSMERCLSVLFPIWYRCRRPKHLSGIACGMLWALSGLFISLTLISCYLAINCEQLLQGISIVNFLIFSLFPLLSNLSLFIKLRCGSQRRHPGKLYVAVLLSVIFLFIFGFPLTVVIFLDPVYVDLFYLHISYLLASLNSSINPVIYFLVGSCRQRRFQGSAQVALRRVFKEKAMSEEGSHVPGDTAVETTV
ncbi:proto-oncogene Mas-like [Nyctibius grandis]|uniref:proto-oncogene Mas-like n=1 Tax=Nyctibius grandis TaxID=48427 RepID=UPI0035BC51F9